MTGRDLKALKQFAAILGWGDLRACRHVVLPGNDRVAGGTVIEWCESGSLDGIYFQINVLPSWRASVYAIRYRICTGWHEFELNSKGSAMLEQAMRLDSWINKRWFSSLDGRREFRRLHPACAGYSWRRIRSEGPPEFATGKISGSRLKSRK